MHFGGGKKRGSRSSPVTLQVVALCNLWFLLFFDLYQVNINGKSHRLKELFLGEFVKQSLYYKLAKLRYFLLRYCLASKIILH